MTNSIRISDDVTIEALNLSANIPIISHKDYSFSFSLVASQVSDEGRKTIIEQVKNILPELQCSAQWGGNNVFHFSIADDRKPGICKHLVKIFHDAGLYVSAMGGNYITPPYWDSSPEVENLPPELVNFANFQLAISKIVGRVIPNATLFR